MFSTATIMSCGWIIYLTYYNSRNIGFVLTLIINRLYKNGYIHIGELVSILFLFAHFSGMIFLFSLHLFIYFTGSFSFSVLSGKVMFRDVYFINEDMSIRYTDTLQLFVHYLNLILFYSYLCSVDTPLITVVCLLTIYTLFMGYIPSFLLYCKLMFQNSRWVTHISLVADVQPQTETTWSVQTHNKQLVKIVTTLFCCIYSTDMFNHNINVFL